MYIYVCIYSIYIHISSSSLNLADIMDFFDSLTICPNYLSLPVGPPNYIQCLHRADLCKFLLVNQYLHIHVKNVYPCFSCSVPNVLFVLLGWFVKWEVKYIFLPRNREYISWKKSCFILSCKSGFHTINNPVDSSPHLCLV